MADSIDNKTRLVQPSTCTTYMTQTQFLASIKLETWSREYSPSYGPVSFSCYPYPYLNFQGTPMTKIWVQVRRELEERMELAPVFWEVLLVCFVPSEVKERVEK